MTSRPTVLSTAGVAAAVLLAGMLTASACTQGGASQNSGQQRAEVRTLGSGATDEGALDADQTHVYQIQLDAGQFLHATVTPHGIDVAATLVGPDGHDLVVANVSSDTHTAEHVMAVAETSGRYEIKIRSAGKVPPGRYVISVDAVRPATNVDVVRLGAWRSLQAARVQDKGDAASVQLGRERLDAALSAFRESGDREGEALTLFELADNDFLQGGTDRGNRADQALALYRELGDQGGITKALGILGTFHERRGEIAEALDAYSQALVLAQASGSPDQEALARNSIGILYGRTGDAERAIDQFRKTLALYRILHHEGRELAFVLNNLGIASKELGDYSMSLQYYEQALALVRSFGDRVSEANLLNNVGNLYRILGEHDKALASHEDALSLARTVGNAEHEARALNALGTTHRRLGDFRKALAYHQQSLAIRRRLDDLRGQASALDGAGLALHALGDDDAALENLKEALRIQRAVAERYAESETLRDLALVERDRGDLARALEDIEAGVQLTDSLRGRVASPDLRASFVAAEHERYEVYVDILMELDRAQPGAGFGARALEANERGRARVLLESLLEARTDVRQGIDRGLLDRERAFQRQLDEASARLSRLLSRTADPGQVNEARSALENLSGEYRQLQARIRQESPGYAALTQPPALTAGEIQRELLDADTLLLEFTLGEKRSWLWIVSPTTVSSFELPPRREIETSARGLYGALTARQPKPNEAPAARSTRVAAAESQWRRESMVVAQALLGQAVARMGEAWRGKRLLIVGADVLEYLPFAALPDPAGQGQPLVENHEIINLPSASVLMSIRQGRADRAPAPKRLAVLADPVFDVDDPRVVARGRRSDPARETSTARGADASDEMATTFVARAARSVDAMGDTRAERLSRLPFTRAEASAITALVAEEDRLQATDFQATRALAMSGDLGAYRFVHFATHGFLNSERPELSGLVLSLVARDGTAQDGFLRLNDIYNLRLSADVVVLSACQTALGKEIKGEGLVGLTRGFMYAGAQSVVASLWQVDDLATAELMRYFYRGMLKDGLRPAAALRAAQLQLSKQTRWASPFFWSAFVLQGEWK